MDAYERPISDIPAPFRLAKKYHDDTLRKIGKVVKEYVDAPLVDLVDHLKKEFGMKNDEISVFLMGYLLQAMAD